LLSPVLHMRVGLKSLLIVQTNWFPCPEHLWIAESWDVAPRCFNFYERRAVCRPNNSLSTDWHINRRVGGVWWSVQAGLSTRSANSSIDHISPVQPKNQSTWNSCSWFVFRGLSPRQFTDPWIIPICSFTERVPLPGRVLHGHQCCSPRGGHSRGSRRSWQWVHQPIRRPGHPAQAEAAQEAPVPGLDISTSISSIFSLTMCLGS